MFKTFLAGNPALNSVTSEQLERIERGAWYHSISLDDGSVIQGIIPISALQERLDLMGVPKQLTGKRVLDIGAATGWNSFEMERRGADVVAVDCVVYEDFLTAKELLKSKVEYRILDIEEISPHTVGTFDYVLFLGVLYHLRHPLLGLERVLSVARDVVFVESFVCDAAVPASERFGAPSYMEFYETTELAGQLDNWCGPNISCLAALCRSAGFHRVQLCHVTDNRAGFYCSRVLPAHSSEVLGASPTISSAVCNRTGKPEFTRGRDEYINLYFRADEAEDLLTRDSVDVEVDGFGVPLLTLHRFDKGVWQANLKTPPDLRDGVLTLRVRVNNGPFSEPVMLFVGCQAPKPKAKSLPEGLGTPELYNVTNGLTGDRIFQGLKSDYLCCAFYLSVDEITVEDVKIEIDGIVVPADFLGKGVGWQANARLPQTLSSGTHNVYVVVGGMVRSNGFTVTLNLAGREHGSETERD